MEPCEHLPVLPTEVLAFLRPEQGGLFLDGTLGLGGHARFLLEKGKGLELLGIDQDPRALEIARERLKAYANVHFFRMSFSEFDTAMQELGWDSLNGVLLDLGVSSLHLDSPQRGFSFLRNGPLDMRMSGEQGLESARDMVNRAGFEELRSIILKYGEEPMAARIARAIVKAREKKAVTDTVELAEIVAGAYPAKRRALARNHPATKTFQALRIAVNKELEELEAFLEKIVPYLASGARLAVISFHSLEDRTVKWFFRREARDCICPREEPVCRCKHKRSLRILTKKPLQAGRDEAGANPRSRSAKLRVAERL
ncbi:MAG: 16S rRNA (cytosine(1402)-N(4))-methyltransferase RsmH [Desulfonatronovibrionaceae bacterium]